MSDLSTSKILAKYINLRNALSVAMTVIVTIMVNEIQSPQYNYIKYIIVLTFLFILWVISYSLEKGGSGFATWLANWMSKKIDYKQEMEVKKLSLAETLELKNHPIKIETHAIQEPIENGKQEDVYQTGL